MKCGVIILHIFILYNPCRCIGEKWEDEVINEFCDLTYCAQWQSLTARVKDYLKDAEDGHDVIWIEVLDKVSVFHSECLMSHLHFIQCNTEFRQACLFFIYRK